MSRLKQIDARMMDLAREVDALRAENARLRGALGKVRINLGALVINPGSAGLNEWPRELGDADAECIHIAFTAARTALENRSE